MIRLRTNQKAFTILELMISSLVFSVILLVITTGMTQIGRSYYQGALQARTQDEARNIIDEIGRGIQFSGETVQPTTPLVAGSPYPTPGAKYAFCINGVGYAYILDRQLTDTTPTSDQTNDALVSFSTTCASFGTPSLPDVATVSGKELLGLNMRLTELNIVDSGNDSYTITVGVASGARDLFSPAAPALSTACSNTNKAGRHFCALSKLTTTVQKRVK